MKKLISLLLAIILMLGIIPAVAEDDFEEFDDFDDDEPVASQSAEEEWEDFELVPYDYDDITIGNPTPLNGQFFTDLFGNSTSDTDVRYLVTGYNLIKWDSEISIFRFDRSVVSGAMVSEDEDGNRSYLVVLYSDLYYSDGTPINAWDYAFSVLLQGSPLIGELGGNTAPYDYLMGYEDYASGSKPYISGLRVPADNIIVFTVKKEALPYFYELSRIAFCPYPIHAIAPGCRVYDDGEGAYIGSEEGSGTPSPLSAALLSETILTPETGYMVHPDPVSGPYRILSYDGVSARFEVNSYYKGNEEGRKPRIRNITFTLAENDTMIENLGNGTFALLNKVAKASTLAEGLSLCMNSPQYARTTYPRVGLTYIYFNPESILVQEQKVRQAIAHCFDKSKFTSDYGGAFAVELDGLYGLGQWMFNAVSGTLAYPGQLPENATAEETAAYEEETATWDELSLDSLTRYDLDTEEAARLLNEAGWTLNEQGNAFDPEKDSVRCKMVDGQLVRLELTLGYQPLADIEQAFQDTLIDYLAEAGIQLTLVPLDFANVVEAHNEHRFDSLDLMYLGDNFNISFDPVPFFHGEEQTKKDSLYAAYQELSALADDMDHTEPADILGYMEKWILFQERVADLLPVIPVYSNVYFDFYTRELNGYYIEEYSSWAQAIVPTRMHSIKTASDRVGIEIELNYANGEGELELASLVGRSAHEGTDYSEGALSLFPDYVISQVPKEYRTIYEFVAGRLDKEIEEGEESVIMEFFFQTPYNEDETVYLLFGIPIQGSDVDWYVREGIGLKNGDVRVELDRELCEKLADITFALAVVSQ